MKKKVISLMLSVAMLTTAFGNFVPFTTAVAAGGNMTITASQDAYVQGGSQVDYTKGTDDKNSLSARDWSDKAGAPSAYMLPYMQFELPSANDFEDIDDIRGIKLKVFCLSGKNDRYIVGLSAFESFDETTITYTKALSGDARAVLSKRLNFDQDGIRIEGSEVIFESVSNDWIEFDVTEKIKELIAQNTSGKKKSVVLTVAPRSRETFPELPYHSTVSFSSKEYLNGLYAPRLEINANARTTKKSSPLTDYYSNADEGEVLTNELRVSLSDTTYMEFAPVDDLAEEDSISAAKVTLNMLPGSAEPAGIRAFALSNVQDESGQELSVTEYDSYIEIDVTQPLVESTKNGETFFVCITGENGGGVPLIFASSRGDAQYRPRMSCELVYQGKIAYLSLDGEQSVQISLDKITEYTYTAVAYDQHGEQTDIGGMNIEYSLDSAPYGVSLSDNGVLTIQTDALPGMATLRVTRADMPEIYGTFDVEILPEMPSSIEIKGAINAKMPKEGYSAKKPYYIEAYNASNKLLPAVFDIDWQVEGPDGISISTADPETAYLVIDNSMGNLSIGDEIKIIASVAGNPQICAELNVTLGDSDQVYGKIIVPVSADTYIKKSDFATAGNTNNNELLAKQRAVTAITAAVSDYFTQEGTNRESYLKFDGLSVLPKDIISAQLELTTRTTFNETTSAPVSSMPKAQLYTLSDTSWQETAGTITKRLSVSGKAIASSVYAVNADAKNQFDITDTLRNILNSNADSAAFRVSMEPVRNNGYVHNYYSKDATLKNEETGLSEPIDDSKKPRLVISASYVRNPVSLRVDGKTKVGIMLEDIQEDYSLYLVDQYDQSYTDEEMKEYTVSLSLKQEYDGVDFDGKTLTVKPYASAQTVTVCASVAEYPQFDTEFDIELYRSKAATVQISGPDVIQIPSGDDYVYANYQIKVFDQLGRPVNIPDAAYELSEPQIGVSMDKDSGVISVSGNAIANREICVVAYSRGNSSIRAEKPVRLVSAPPQTGREMHPSLLYSNEDLVPVRTKINTEPFATYYSSIIQQADSYTADELTYYAQTDPRESEDDPYDHVYPLVVTDENGNEKVLDRKRPWQWMATDLFYTQGNFTFNPPKNTKYARLQAVAKGQGITHFDKFTFKIESGNSIELYNADMETGNQRYVNEDIPYTDGSRYQVVETSPGGWEYLSDVQTPMPDGWYYIRKVGSDSTFEWANQSYQRDRIAASGGLRSAKIVNNNINSYAGISTDKISVTPGTTYVLSTGFGGNDKLIGQKGRLPEYSPLDKTAGVSMQVVYYDENDNEIGTLNWENTVVSGKPMNINWQVKPLRRSFDGFFDDCCAIYAITKNIDYAIKAKEILKYQLEDMKWGMRYRTTSGYNAKMNDTYEAVHTGRTLQRDALGYDMIYDSGVTSEEEDAYIRSLFNWVAYELTSTSYYNYGASNGRIHNYNADRISALILYALCFPDNTGTEAKNFKDNFDFFYNHVMNPENVWSFPTMVKDGVYDAGDEYGGMWCENMRYQCSVQRSWLLAAKALDRYDPSNSWVQRDEFKKLARMWITTQGPRLVVSTNAKNLAGYPTVGDQSWREDNIDMAGWCAGIYKNIDPEMSSELMYTWDRMGGVLGKAGYPISVFLDVDTTIPRKNPQLSSMSLKNVGYTYFWQNFGELGQENMVLMPNSPGYGNRNQVIHDHHDRGSFAYFAKGTPMSLDSGMGSYFGSDTKFWRSSRSHNVILFWSEPLGEWLSTSGGDGSGYTSDTGNKRYFDSKTRDFFTSDEIDRVTIDVNPETRDSKATNLQWNRHFAYIKDGINALVFWDEIKNTRKSQFNLFMASKDYTQYNDMVLADMHNDMQMEVHLLGSNNPKITGTWVPSAGAYGFPTVDGAEQQQRIQYEQTNGKDYLTVLFAKDNGADGLVSEKLETGNENITAYRMENADGKSFYIAVNEGDKEATCSISNTKTIRNPQTGDKLNANETFKIAKGQMMVFVDDTIDAPKAVKIRLSGETVVGVPYNDSVLSYSYEARVFDQYGAAIDGVQPQFEIVGNQEYCTIDQNGTLTLLPGFESGTKIKLKAEYEGVEEYLDIIAATADTKVASVAIEGSNTLIIPQNGTSSYVYKAMFKNASGAPVSGATPLWTLLSKTEGVTMNSYTGEINIDSDVKSGTVIHISVALYNDPSVNKTLEILITEEKESGIYVDAPQEYAITAGAGATLRLSGYITNQQGEKYIDGGIEYSLKTAVPGVSVSKDGIITIDSSVKPGKEIVVTAQSLTNGKNKKEYRIKLVDNGIASIIISGDNVIKARKSDVKVTYIAKVTDKNGSELDKDVIWSISGHSGVSVESGVVTVKEGAYSGTAVLVASLKEDSSVTAQLEIRIKEYTETVGSNGSGSGGGGGSGGSSGGGVAVVPVKPVEPQGINFADMPQSHWAYEYVKQLTQQGAVNGKTSDTFEPDTNITRAEFVKILVKALGLTSKGSEANFSDVSSSDWYYESVVTVTELGIVNGYSDGRFGANDRITREQMAAIIYRALNVMGTKLDISEEKFADMDSIGEYAQDAVLALKQAGIINGKGNNLFAPADNATRAEASKVICMLCNLVLK